MIDIDNFIEYYILEIFIDNFDRPQNNVRVWRYNEFPESGVKDGRYRYLLYDTDCGYGRESGIIASENDSFKYLGEHENPLFRSLMMNDEFKKQFLIRMCDHLNSIYSTEKVVSVIDDFEGVYIKEIEENYLRWYPWEYDSPENWSDKTVSVIRGFADIRGSYVLKYAAENYNISPCINFELESFNGADVIVNDDYIIKSGSTDKILNYFSEYPTVFEATDNDYYQFSHWVIKDENGIDASDSVITADLHNNLIEVQSDKSLIINPVFKKK
jgi:hypothetical protein